MTKFLCRAGVIGAIYAALILIASVIPGFGVMQFGMVQVRVAEALTVLAAITPAAIPGLFVGCLLSNIIGMAFLGGSLLDVIFGSLATLLAAWCSWRLRRFKWLVPLPPVLINAIVVGIILKITALPEVPLWLLGASVGAGQAIACYGLGMPLLFYCQKHAAKLRLGD